MSGSAALSAARKRRASGGGPIMNSAAAAAAGAAPATYYGRGQPSVIQGGGANDPQNYTQSYSQTRLRDIATPSPPASAIPPMNIYENIELIKQQLDERTKKIQREGATIPPEQLRMLQRQNEIQIQILKQKMMIAKQMESIEGNPAKFGPAASGPLPMNNEPEFIYERGVPRKNPKYMMNKNEIVQQQQQQQQTPVAPAANRGVPHQDNVILTPFVSMFSDTGAIPPPIVVLKSHDSKLEEHNNLLHDIVEQIVELQNTRQAAAAATTTAGAAMMKVDAAATNDDENRDDNGDNDEELLMDVVMSDLTNSREFVEGIVNKIVNETNLSEVIMKIEPLVKENQELRSLIHSQQQMMNEMNTMLLRLLNKESTTTTSETTYDDNGLDGDGLYTSETTEIVLPHYDDDAGMKIEATQLGVIEEEESAATADEEAVAAAAVEEAAEAAEAAEATATLEATAETATISFSVSPRTQDEEYSSPHFPDPISLIVRDIDHSDNA
jgi:hypothetical protein